MKKGFTLVEMLGVLVILALIFILAFPDVINNIVNGEENVEKASEKNIIESAKDYVSKNEINRELEKYCLSLDELVVRGFLRKDSIADSLKDKTIEIGITKSKLSYSLVDECTAITSNVITLIGDKRTKVEINGSYSEQGATAKDKNMVDISSQITHKIYNSKGQEVNSIDTNKLGNYSVEYTLMYDGIEDKIYRDVDIVDTIKPVITVASNYVSISPQTTTFNLLEGISASDNSGEVIDVSVTTDLALGAIGTYSIKYSAKDSSGNEGIARKIVVIK